MFFLSVAYGGGGGYQMYRPKIAHRTRGSICYHNFPNKLLSSHFLTIFLHGNFCERAKRASRNFHILRRKHTFIFNSLLVNHIFVNTTDCP